mmetsp:Transcript_33035/g.37915  ORF Transcript_33035/g.37915 Transcript_33035/m.37915 type:complete len:88 (-) Transcript_33035:541-804(-)
MRRYWKRVKETIQFLISDPRFKKKFANSILFKIYEDNSVNMENRIKKYLKEYAKSITEKRYEFRQACKANPAKGALAKFAYNLLRIK